jgi:cytoskeleton protein RodZ
MNAVVDEAAKNVTEFRAPGPGERLRSARLARGLELSKLAAQLHLSEDLVQALERDDFDALPGRVFVRGYVRNYARLVGIPVDSVMKQLDEQLPEEVQQRTLNPVGAGMRREVGSSHGLVRLFTWMVLLVVIGLFVVWWQGYLSWQSAETAMAEDVAGAEDAPVTALPVAEDGSLALPRSEEAIAVEPEAPVAPPPAVEPVPAPVVAPVSSAEPPAAPATAEGAAAPAGSGTAAAAAAAATETGSPATLAAPPSIVMEFDGPCWVDVRDAKRKFKLFGEMPKGTRKVLGGEPPYDIVLGNAAVVRVSIDGQAYDVAQHALGNVARFRLAPDVD